MSVSHSRRRDARDAVTACLVLALFTFLAPAAGYAAENASTPKPRKKVQEVDLVLLVNTYSYISNRVPYFTRLKEAIRPGGDIIIIDFKKKETPFGPAIEERVDVGDVEKELKDAGYTLLKIDQESLEYQYIIKAHRN